jgi:hypothetical protein
MKLGVWAVLLVCLLSAVVRGDEESDRKQYIDDIDRLLDGMADDLSRVLSDSGPGYVDYATKRADELKDKVSRLSNVKGSDDKAKRYADYYGRYADSFKEYAKSLRSLKEGQKSLDELPRRCDDSTKELIGKIRVYTDNNDPAGFEAVPKLAREYGRIGKEAIELAERKKSDMYQWYDKTDDFSESDGKWSYVRSNLAYAGRGIWDYFSPKYELVKRDEGCGNLAKEERNPLVEQESKKLYEGKLGIEATYSAMEGQLSEIASYMNDLEGDSGTSDIDSAERKADELSRNVDKLDRIRGQDREARRRVEVYGNNIRAFTEALKHLRTLKYGQFLVDRAADKCGEADKNLDGFIRKYTDRGDTAGAKLIPSKAHEIGDPIKASLLKADDQNKLMEKARNDALRFGTEEGRWRDVSNNLKESANGIWDHWKRAWETAHKQCDEIAKADQDKDVVRAVNDLSSIGANADRELASLRDAHARWYDEIKQLRQWYTEDTANVRQLFCTLEESDGDEEVGASYAAQLAQIADRMRDRLAPKWGDLKSRADGLKDRAKQLIKVEDEADRKGASVILDKLVRTMNSIENVLNNELKGANDPEVRAQMELGKLEHKRIQADSGKCDRDATEITIPGSGKRIDCVQVTGNVCFIYEIKPNNSSALSKGRSQAEGYMKAVQSYFETNKAPDKLKAAFSDRMKIFLQCIDNGQIRLDIGVRAYDFCPADGKLFNDFVVPSE